MKRRKHHLLRKPPHDAKCACFFCGCWLAQQYRLWQDEERRRLAAAYALANRRYL